MDTQEKIHEDLTAITLALAILNTKVASVNKELHLIAVAITAVSIATFAIVALFLAYGVLVYALA